MLTFSRNDNRDLYLDSTNNIALAEDLEACLQSCEAAVSTMLNEQIYQTNQGVPNFGLVWSGTPNLAQAEVAIRNTIESVPNVISVLDFEYDVADGSTFRYNATIKTAFGVGKIYNGL